MIERRSAVLQHAREMTALKKLRATNPEIRAVVNGKPHNHRVKWTDSYRNGGFARPRGEHAHVSEI